MYEYKVELESLKNENNLYISDTFNYHYPKIEIKPMYNCTLASCSENSHMQAPSPGANRIDDSIAPY